MQLQQSHPSAQTLNQRLKMGRTMWNLFQPQWNGPGCSDELTSFSLWLSSLPGDSEGFPTSQISFLPKLSRINFSQISFLIKWSRISFFCSKLKNILVQFLSKYYANVLWGAFIFPLNSVKRMFLWVYRPPSFILSNTVNATTETWAPSFPAFPTAGVGRRKGRVSIKKVHFLHSESG